jgi:hypothetical protein
MVHVPTGSAVSLGHSAQSLVGYYWQAFGASPLSGLLTGVVSRVNAGLPDGTSRYSHTLAARGIYSMHPGDALEWPGKVYLELARVMRSGTSGTTGVTGSWTFPLRPKTLDAELALFRGLTKGARDTGIELVFAWHF